MQKSEKHGIIKSSGGNAMNKQDIHELIQKQYLLTINETHQNKHIAGSSNFDPARGTLTADPLELIKLYAGKGNPIQTNSGNWSQRERFVHTSVIGIWRDKNTGGESPINAGIIHYTKDKGAHIVPANPNQRGGRES